MEEQIVETLADADVGSVVWRYHSERTRNVDGKYAGRGVWAAEKVTAKTRMSLECSGAKFDIKTGRSRPVRGYCSRDVIAGKRERFHADYKNSAWAIADRVRYADAETLVKVAELVGWKP